MILEWIQEWEQSRARGGEGGGDSLAISTSVLSVHEVHIIPDVTIRRGSTADGMRHICAICTEDFVAGEIAKSLACHHLFHEACILPWLTHYKGCCPLCMRNVCNRH